MCFSLETWFLWSGGRRGGEKCPTTGNTDTSFSVSVECACVVCMGGEMTCVHPKTLLQYLSTMWDFIWWFATLGLVLAFILLLVSGCTLQLNLVFSIGTRLVCVAVLPCASSIWCHWHSASSIVVSLPPSICSPPTPLPCLFSPTVGPPLLLPIYFHVEIVSYIFSGRKWVVSPPLCVCAHVQVHVGVLQLVVVCEPAVWLCNRA